MLTTLTVLEAALERAAFRSRFVMCGSISGYNNRLGGGGTGVRNLHMVTVQRVRMEGFIVVDWPEEVPAAKQQLGQWIAEGKIKRKETIIKGGLKVADTAIGNLFNGGNTGKLIVEVKPYEVST